MAKAYELRNLELDEISLVDKGANRGAKVVLMKRAMSKADATVVHKPEEDLPFHVMQDGKVQAKHPTKGRAEAHAARLNTEVGKGEEYWKRDFSQDQRDAMAESGEAMSDGSFPIKSKQDLQNAIHAIGRAKNPDKVKAHIKTRARALGATDMLPEDWKTSKRTFLQVIKDMLGTEPAMVKTEDEDEDDKPSTFAEELLERRMGDILEESCDYICALQDVIRETLQGNGLGPDDDPEEIIMQAVKDFAAAMESKVPQWMSGEVGKAGRKISAARLEKLKNLYKTLSDIIGEQEPNEDMGGKTMSKIDVSKLDAATRAHIESLEADAKAGQEAVAKAKKDAEDAAKAEIAKAQKQAEEAEKIAKAERDARLDREYGEKVSVFKRLAVKPDDAKVFREIDEKCSADVAKRVWEIMAGANEAMKSTAILTGQIGSSNGDDGFGDPVSKVQELAKAAIAKSDGKMKHDAAMAKVFSENPGLYAAYTAAVSIKV